MGADTSSLTHRELCITTVEILFTLQVPFTPCLLSLESIWIPPTSQDTFSKFGLINYNFETFKSAIKEVFEVRIRPLFFCRVGPLSSCRGEEEVLFWPILPHVGFRLGTLQGFRPAGLQSSLPQLSATASAA